MNFITEKKKSQQYVVLYSLQKWVVHWPFKFWVFSGICCQKLSVEWHWLKLFLEAVSFVSTADKFVTNGWLLGQPSLIALTMTGFTRYAKYGFHFWKWSNLAWSS